MKKVIALLTALLMLFMFAACESTDKPSESEGASSSATSVTQPESSEAQPESSEQQSEEVSKEASEETSEAVSEEISEGESGEVTADLLFNIVAQIYTAAADKSQRAAAYLENGRDSFNEFEMESGVRQSFGTTAEFEKAVCSKGFMMPDTYALCLFKPKADANIEQLKTTIKDTTDLGWQICVVAEDLEVVDNGGYILMVMGGTEDVQAIKTAFKSLNLG